MSDVSVHATAAISAHIISVLSHRELKVIVEKDDKRDSDSRRLPEDKGL